MIIYPPYIDGILPAFVEDGKIKIPYQMNPGVNFNEVKGFSLRIKNQNSQSILAETYELQNYNQEEILFSYSSDSTDDRYFAPKAGEYYKVQLAYRDKEGNTSPYSTVGVIKCIANLNYTFSILGNNIIFTYSKDNAEPLYNYSIQIFDNKNNLLKSYEENASFEKETYNHYYWFKLGQEYTIKLNATTLNLYSIISEVKVNRVSIDENEIKNASISSNYDEGLVRIQAAIPNVNNQSLRLYRSRQGLEDWQLMSYIKTSDGTIDYLDTAIEHGAIYDYQIATENENGYVEVLGRINNIEPVYFEDSFLSDGDKTLKLRFNPKISSIKDTILETKTDTIGGKFPFFFRNGNVRYKEFPISGLISYWSDEAEKFMAKQEFGLENDLSLRKRTNGQRAVVANTPTTGLRDYNIAAERKFKMAVFDWLNNGRPKLLKTPTEGTFIVRLMNVSLSPEDQLGRMLHNFQATAYEIADFSLDNCINLNLMPKLENSTFDIAASANRILTSQNVAGLNDNLELKNIEHIEFYNFPTDTKIEYTLFGQDEIQVLTIDYAGQVVINETISQLTIPSNLKTGEITYIQLEQLQTYVYSQPKIINESNTIFNASSDDYIYQVDIFGATNFSKYQIDNNEEILLGENQVSITNLNAKTITLVNCKGMKVYLATKEGVITAHEI